MSRLSRSLFLSFFLLSFFFSFLPLHSVEAALVPCGRQVDDQSTPTINETAPCTLCHLVLGGKGVIDYGLRLMTILAIAVIVAMAIYYIVSSGNDSMMSTAKGGIKAALIGFALMLGAWLLVNTAIRILGANIPGLTLTGNGFSFSCSIVSQAGTGTAGTVDPGFIAAAPGADGTEPLSVTDDRSGQPVVRPDLPAPTALSSTNASPSQTSLSWTPVAGASGYEIERCAGTSCTAFSSLGTTTQASYTDTDLSAGQNYTYRVRTVTSEGVSAWSGTTTLATASSSSAPQKPTLATTGGDVSLSWTPVSGASSYEIQRCEGIACSFFTALGTTTGTSYIDSSVQGSTTYSYRLRAVTTSGTTSWSSIGSVTASGDTGGSGSGTANCTSGFNCSDGVSGGGSTGGGVCATPGSSQFLYGKSWANDRTSNDGVPLHTTVAFDGNGNMTLAITCRFSSVGRGSDVTPQVTAPIGNMTASSFSVLANRSQTLANNQGYTCNVQAATGTANYTPQGTNSVQLFGLNFAGSCTGSGGSTSGSSGGPSSVPSNTTITLTSPTQNGSYNIGSPIPISWNVTGAPSVTQVILQVSLVTASGGASGLAGGSSQTNPISSGNSSGSYQWPTGSGNLTTPGLYEVVAIVRKCNSGGCSLANDGGVAGQGTDYAQSSPVRFNMVTSGGTSSGSSSGSGSSSSSSTPSFPWTIQGNVYYSLSAVEAAFAPSCVNVNGVRVLSGFGPCANGTAP